MSIIDEYKDAFKCEKCGIMLRSASTETNVCHGCDRVVCNKCRTGPVCKDCIEKLSMRERKNIRNLHLIKMFGFALIAIGMFGAIIAGFGMEQGWVVEEPPVLLITMVIVCFGGVAVALIFRGILYTYVNKSIGNELY